MKAAVETRLESPRLSFRSGFVKRRRSLKPPVCHANGAGAQDAGRDGPDLSNMPGEPDA